MKKKKKKTRFEAIQKIFFKHRLVTSRTSCQLMWILKNVWKAKINRNIRGYFQKSESSKRMRELYYLSSSYFLKISC